MECADYYELDDAKVQKLDPINYDEAVLAAAGMIPIGNGGKAVRTADEIATLVRVEAQVADETAAIARVATNPIGLVLEGRPAGTILQQQIIKRAEGISTVRPGQVAAPRDINEQVMWNQVKADPAAGSGLSGMNNDPRFPKSAGFQKMQVTHELPDGTNITIHYQYNSKTGKAYDMKIVTPQRSALQRGPSVR